MKIKFVKTRQDEYKVEKDDVYAFSVIAYNPYDPSWYEEMYASPEKDHSILWDEKATELLGFEVVSDGHDLIIGSARFQASSAWPEEGALDYLDLYVDGKSYDEYEIEV